MIAYKVVAMLDKAEKQLRQEIQEIPYNLIAKERLLKARSKLQEALTILLGGD